MLESLYPALTIFCLRCVDVSLGTLRLILTVQGRRSLAALIGFFEVSVFITAVASVVGGPLDYTRVLGYGAGFATGTFVGVTIDRCLGLGDVVVRAITGMGESVVAALTDAGFGVTLIEGRGGRGTLVSVVFSVCQRKRVPDVLRVIHQADEAATLTVEDVRQRFHGYFAPKRPGLAPLGPVKPEL